MSTQSKSGQINSIKTIPLVLSGVDNPSVVAVDAIAGTLYLQTVAPFHSFKKQDDGLTVNWDEISALATGPANALAYYDALGINTGDAALTAIPIDQFGRPQIRDLRQAAGVGAVLRQGAWTADGDAQDLVGEGLVVYGKAPNGLQDNANGTIGRVKSDRFQIRMIQAGIDIGSAWRVDPTHMFFTDDAGVQTAEVVRATGVATFNEVRTGGAAGARFLSGNGVPNGVVNGNVGDIYTDLTGGAGTTLYVKEAGAGNNVGWVAK